jgi:transposase-like protein
VITVAVRWYLRYSLSYRDLEELLAERGVEVDHVTVYRWVQRFTPLFADAARPLRDACADRWFVDETYVKVAGRWRYLYRAVDQYGQVIDVLLSEQRDTAAARRFFTGALRYGPAPVEATTELDRRSLHTDTLPHQAGATDPAQLPRPGIGRHGRGSVDATDPATHP